MKIQRYFYLNQLISGRENGLIKIITGKRSLIKRTPYSLAMIGKDLNNEYTDCLQ